ncbi:hypothetical protein J2S05_003406 [Alkalicoccobacillus murimartini]|uniref:Relaxase/mobilization nuclease domain-containing protein n=2 Tax=Alkalicoccobacillus murimartini TaxID=171685 RepID=A0ABT9YL47_9BACI|nr:hypothetical protein [Alkalicoccobacillus murimartini]
MYEAKQDSVMPLTSLKNHLKYIEMIGKRNKYKTYLFNDHSNEINPREFIKKLNHQPKGNVPGFRLIITYDEQYSRRHMFNHILKAINTLEVHNDEKYDWLGIFHIEENSIPHVHIIIRALDSITDERIEFYPNYIPKIKLLLEEEIQKNKKLYQLG